MSPRRNNRSLIATIALALLVIACSVLLSSCGGSSSSPNDSSSSPSSTSANHGAPAPSGSSENKPGSSLKAKHGKHPLSPVQAKSAAEAEVREKVTTEQQRASSIKNLSTCLKEHGALTKSPSGTHLESKNPAKLREAVRKCGTVIPKKGLVPNLPHKPGTVSPGTTGNSKQSPLKTRIGAYLNCLKEHGITSPGHPGANPKVSKQQYAEATQTCRALLFQPQG